MRMLTARACTLLGKVGEALELRRLESGRRTWLERAAHQQLRWQQRCEVHVETGLRGGHVAGAEAIRRHPARVDRLNVGP